MVRWLRRKQPPRAALIARKHELGGQIRMLTADIKRLRAENAPTADAERRLARLRSLHYRTRQDIDRADP